MALQQFVLGVLGVKKIRGRVWVSVVIEPMSEEESHKCCVSHLLNCDEGRGQ
jgi:hypothetical protein